MQNYESSVANNSTNESHGNFGLIGRIDLAKILIGQFPSEVDVQLFVISEWRLAVSDSVSSENLSVLLVQFVHLSTPFASAEVDC